MGQWINGIHQIGKRFYWIILTGALSSLSNAGTYTTESGLEIIPSLQATYGYDGNIIDDRQNELSSTYSAITPEISFLVDRRRISASLNYKFQKGNYFSSSQDNYIDHYLTSNSQYRWGLRNTLELNVYYAKAHTARGGGATSGIPLDSIIEPLEYREFSFTPKYTYGSKTARANLSGWYGFYNRRHDNFTHLNPPLENESTRYDDVDIMSLGSEFTLKIRSRLQWITRYELRDSEYINNNPNRPSQNNLTHEIYTGVKWDLSEKTNGFAKIGYQNKSFDDEARQNFNGINYALNINWRPKNFSTFGISTSYLTKDPQQNGDFTKEWKTALSWQYDWNPRVYTRLQGSYVEEDIVGSSNNNRDDETTNLGFELGYKLNDIVNLSVKYQDSEIR